eukprot:TRINITY_DN18980_c0_g1_i1.p1 TRINITY_DN18980_c0_g1~~TRINITY_DN18980_c0_g1_i1.p1  ORF type:complete len:775 (-),score=134.67 TRINITY_DN18980_c0_g1_i1:824-3148(-)
MVVADALLRFVLLCSVPTAAAVLGFVPDALSIILSGVAVLFEIAMLASHAPSPKRKGNAAGPPLRFFLVRLAALCLVQVWSLLLHESMKPDTAAESIGRDRHTAQMRGALASASALHASVQSESEMPRAVERAPERPAAPEQTAPAPPTVPRELSRVAPASLAAVGEGNFDVDAPPELLRWKPETISVVLPCAEERDLAFKTVKSVYETTPADILHEIVVVDDGSNPPLSATHLDEKVQKQYKVLIKRHENTVGLIGAKKTGGDAATGDIIVFFDCHVGPQKRWYEDFMQLIGENYRRMVIPQITALDIDTWTQIGEGGGMSKCYVTWDGDFKWGGTDDMYMGMLSGGLAGMSRQWWDESGGFDNKMLGWGGENIDQGVRMWVCGGEIVAAPNSQVAHMWRTGAKGTGARYRHVGDTIFNRARAVSAWFQEFSVKLDDYPMFYQRKTSGGAEWIGDMSTFQKVRDRLNGCRPFAWYLKRFKVVYEDAGLVPQQIFMIKEEQSGKCMLFMGHAGTSGSGSEGVMLSACDENNPRFFWHLGNRNRRTHKCCSGLRAWNTDQCLQGGQGGGRGVTGICELSGSNFMQGWSIGQDGQLSRGGQCLGPDGKGGIEEGPCMSFRNKGGSRFTKIGSKEPIERQLYVKAQQEHPAMFARLNAQMGADDPSIPHKCRESGVSCVTLTLADDGTSQRCLDGDAGVVQTKEDCALFYLDDAHFKLAESGKCLDTWSDQDPLTWGLYDCHSGDNQKFSRGEGSKFCTLVEIDKPQCFELHEWTPR